MFSGKREVLAALAAESRNNPTIIVGVGIFWYLENFKPPTGPAQLCFWINENDWKGTKAKITDVLLQFKKFTFFFFEREPTEQLAKFLYRMQKISVRPSV